MTSANLTLSSAAREAVATLGKAALALTIFGSVIYGFQYASARQSNAVLAALPLPDKTVQSDCAVWFIGSSSMSRWSTLQQDMNPWSTHNRSIGGASLEEITRRFRNDEDPQRPQAIIFYAGENDIAFGVPVETVVSRFKDFMNAKTKQFGSIPVLFVSVKPSPARWEQRGAQDMFNRAISALVDQRADLRYIDTVPQLIVNGRPGPFFGEDGLHFNSAGYHILADAVGQGLSDGLAPAVVQRCAPASDAPASEA